jgi:endonuclease/exonuclease/phosphatase family metal-dependent hydrolase
MFSCEIGTFNLENFPRSRSEEEVKALAGFIGSLDVEVLALQEIASEESLNDLLDCLPKNRYKYVLSQQSGIIQRVAVLYQPKEVSITYEDEIYLHNDEHPKQRDALVVNGKVLPKGFDFTLVVVHLAHNDRPWRETQLELLREWIVDRLDSDDERDIIIAGDFNEPLLLGKGIDDWLSGGESLYVVTQEAPDTQCTPGDKYYSEPIDHIVISPDCKAEYTKNSSVFCDYFKNEEIEYRESFSDHCVLWASFSPEDMDGVTPTPEFPLVPSCALRIIDLPESIHPGNEMTVRAQTFPNAECTIAVRYASGTLSEAKGLENHKAGLDGLVKWTWEIGPRTQTGSATVRINARWEKEWESGHTRTTGTFEVTK